MSKILNIGIVAGLGILLAKLVTWNTAKEMMNFSLSNPRIFSVDLLQGIHFKTEIQIQNPTKTRIKVSKPVITLTTNGKPLASSVPQNKEYSIEPLTTTTIDSIEVILPWSAMGKYVLNILTKYSLIKAAFVKKDLKEFGKLLGIPLEMSYTLYTGAIFYQSPIQKII